MLKTADTNSHSCDEDGTGRADESNDGTSGGEAEAQADEIEAHSAPSNAANSVVEILDKHQRSARARRTNYAAFYALDPDAELDVNVSASSAPIESAQDSTKQQRNASRSSATSTKNKTNNSAPNNNNNSNPTVSGTIIANNYNYSSSKGSSSRAKQSPATKDRDRKDRASSDDLAQSTSVNSQTSDADNSVTGNDDGSITRCVCLLSQGDDDSFDGVWVQCEECLVWQHCDCVGLSSRKLPKNYFCELCRPIDHPYFKLLTKQKSTSSSKSLASKKRNTMNSLDSANLFEYPEFNIANGPSVQQKDQFSLLDSVSEKASSKFAKNGANSSVRKRGRDVDALDITPDRLSEKRTKNDGDVRQIEAKAAPPKSVIGNSKTTKGKKPPFANNNVSAIDAARNSQQSWNSTSTESLSSYTAINDVEWDSTSIDAERLPNSEFPQDIIGDTGNHLEHTRSTTNNKATTANSHSLNSTLKSSGGNSRSLYPPSLSQANGSSMPKSHGPSNTENRHHHQHHHHQSYLASTTSTGSGANGKPRHLLHHRTSLSDIKKRVAQLATYVRTFEHEILISRPVSITKDSTKTLLPQCVCANRNTIITKKSVKGLFNSNDNSSSSSSSRSSSSTSSSSKKIDFTNENGEITEGSRHELEPSDYNTTVAISSNVDTAVAYIAQSAPPLIAAPILTPPLSTASPSPIFGSLARLSSADSGGVLRDTQSTSSVELNSQIACLEICSICEGQISNNFNGSNLGEKAKADDGGLVEDKINSAAVLKRLMWRLDEFGKTFGSC